MQRPVESRFPMQLALSLLFATLSLPAINLVIDPTEIFGTRLLPHRFQVNDRFQKFQYLLEGCGACTGFLLGSSRMGYTDPALFDGLLSRGRCYNMNISSANAWDYLQFARYLQRKQRKPELLVVQLDLTQEFGDRGRYQHHPDFSGETRFRFYFENLFSIAYQSLLGKLWYNLRDKDSTEFNWEKGQRSRPDADRMTGDKADSPARFQPEIREDAASQHVDSGRFRRSVDQTIDAVRDLREYADAEGVRLIILVTPHNQHYLDRYRGDDIDYFLARLADTTSFWNFASYSSVTTDDRNYYESSHYRPAVGALIAARVGERASGGVPADFGRWVTRANVDSARQELKRQIERRKLEGLRGE